MSAPHCAVVIGSTGAIGAAFCAELSRQGVTTVGLSRSGADAVDLLNEDSIAKAAASIAAQGLTPDLILVATGVLHDPRGGPEKRMADLDADRLLHRLQVNAVGPLLIAKHFLPLMPRGQRSVFAALSARVGSISDNRSGGWYGYRMGKAALNMAIRNLSIEWQRSRAEHIIVGLHPGTVDSALSRPFQGNLADGQLRTADVAASQMLSVLDRLTPADSGQIFAYDGTPIIP